MTDHQSLSDTELVRLVRSMPHGSILIREGDTWTASTDYRLDYSAGSYARTPEDALVGIGAGLATPQPAPQRADEKLACLALAWRDAEARSLALKFSPVRYSEYVLKHVVPSRNAFSDELNKQACEIARAAVQS